VDQSNERYFTRGPGIAYGRPAAGRIPAERTFRCQAQAGDMFFTMGEQQVCGRYLEDISTTVFIENSTVSREKVGKGLAIVAITYGPVADSGGCIR